jgi:hypothetical protein
VSRREGLAAASGWDERASGARGGHGGRGRGRRGLLSAVAELFVEPVEAAAPAGGETDLGWSGVARPAIAVAGLAPRAGTTTVARALAAELALRDREGAAIVSAETVAGGGVPLGTPAAGRLGRAVQRALPARTRAVGRVCLTAVGPDQARLVDTGRELAPVVLDVPDPGATAVAASLVDAVVLVGSPSVEPALAAVVADSLARIGPEAVVVLNRDRDGDQRWEGRCALRLPESRMGAQLAAAGREPRGDLGRAVAALADLLAVGT